VRAAAAGFLPERRLSQRTRHQQRNCRTQHSYLLTRVVRPAAPLPRSHTELVVILHAMVTVSGHIGPQPRSKRNHWSRRSVTTTAGPGRGEYRSFRSRYRLMVVGHGIDLATGFRTVGVASVAGLRAMKRCGRERRDRVTGAERGGGGPRERPPARRRRFGEVRRSFSEGGGVLNGVRGTKSPGERWTR
jgi:hypothetical protein